MANPVLAGIADQLDWQPLKSSNVAAAAYADDFGMLFVRFRNGSVYAYRCPKGTYQGLLSAPSAGGYVFAVVRGGRKNLDGVYPYYRVR